MCCILCVVLYQGGRKEQRSLRVRRTAAVNAALTGSVDKVSPWQRFVDVSRGQKTHMNMAAQPNTTVSAVQPLGEQREKELMIANRM